VMIYPISIQTLLSLENLMMMFTQLNSNGSSDI
jgi:hypothetical protein